MYDMDDTDDIDDMIFYFYFYFYQGRKEWQQGHIQIVLFWSGGQVVLQNGSELFLVCYLGECRVSFDCVCSRRGSIR